MYVSRPRLAQPSAVAAKPSAKLSSPKRSGPRYLGSQKRTTMPTLQVATSETVSLAALRSAVRVSSDSAPRLVSLPVCTSPILSSDLEHCKRSVDSCRRRGRATKAESASSAAGASRSTRSSARPRPSRARARRPPAPRPRARASRGGEPARTPSRGSRSSTRGSGGRRRARSCTCRARRIVRPGRTGETTRADARRGERPEQQRDQQQPPGAAARTPWKSVRRARAWT